jgi:hypothetical protein
LASKSLLPGYTSSSLDPWCLSRFSNIDCGHSYSDETQLFLNILGTI